MIPNLSTAAFQSNLPTLPPYTPPFPPTQSLYVNPARIRIGEKREREREGVREREIERERER